MVLTKRTAVSAVMAAVLLTTLLYSAGFTGAEEQAEQLQYSLNMSLEDNLRLFTGKQVTVTLTSGGGFSGRVKDVKNGLLHLEKLTDKSYYDALIRTEHISAFDTQVRGLR